MCFYAQVYAVLLVWLRLGETLIAVLFLFFCRYEEGGDGASSAEVSNSVDMSVTDEAQGRDNSVGKSDSNPAATSSASVVPPVVTLNTPQVEMRR